MKIPLSWIIVVILPVLPVSPVWGFSLLGSEAGYSLVVDRLSAQDHQGTGHQFHADAYLFRWQRAQWGFRTAMVGQRKSGGQTEQLASGPVAQWRQGDWSWSFAGLYFAEQTTFDQKRLQSRGMRFDLGWQRLWELTSHAVLGMGGFVTYNRGNAWHPSQPTAKLVPFYRLSQGMQLLLRTEL